MADGRHFVNRYISLSQPRIVRLWQNMVCERKFWPYLRKCEKNWEIHKCKMADGRHTENHFFGNNSAPYCPIKTIFGVRRLNCPHTNFDKGDGNVIKNQKYPNSKWRMDPHWKSVFGYNSTACCSIKMKFGVRRQNHTHTQQVRWITKIQYSGRQHFKNGYLRMSRESSKFDEIWYTNANFDTTEQTWQR